MFEHVHPAFGKGFNPRPAPKSGAIFMKLNTNGLILWFQSAPRSEERGDKRNV